MKPRRYRPSLDSSPIEQRAIEVLSADLAGASPNLIRFFIGVFTADAQLDAVKTLARGFGYHPSTLRERFVRRGLPSPNRYRLGAKFVRAAYLLEDPAVSCNRAGLTLGCSTPQSFYYTIRTFMRMSGQEFRATYTGTSMLDWYRRELVAPNLASLLSFDPFTPVALRHAQSSARRAESRRAS